MTSHLNSHRTTDIKPEMLSGVQTGNGTPHDKYNIRGIAHARTNRKDNIFMQRRLVQNFTFILEWGQGTCSLTKHTRGWAYSRYLFPACCLLRFAAFFSHCLIPFNCLNLFKMFNSVWKCSTHAVMNNFWLVSLTCLGWFRVVQNGSNGLKRLKKSSLFSNCA